MSMDNKLGSDIQLNKKKKIKQPSTNYKVKLTIFQK